MSNIKYLFIILLLLFLFQRQYAGNTQWFRYMPYACPFISNIRAGYNSIETGLANKVSRYYYLEKDKLYPYFTANFAINVPLFEKISDKSRWGIVIPLHNTSFMDMFDSRSTPLLNNDYRTGIYIKMIRYFNQKMINNLAFRICPVFHESTHIGDEFSIHGMQKVAGFKRVNISYEAWEFYIIINDPDTLDYNVLSLSIGASGLLNTSKGYYHSDSTEVQNQQLYPSDRFMEYFLGLNYQRIQGWLCSKKWRNIYSMGINNRSLLNYESDIVERRTWSVQVLAGYELNRGSHFIKVANYLKYYYGINPHGMFRNEYNYHYIGFFTVVKFN